jgi:hypothetical protein
MGAQVGLLIRPEDGAEEPGEAAAKIGIGEGAAELPLGDHGGMDAEAGGEIVDGEAGALPPQPAGHPSSAGWLVRRVRFEPSASMT